VEDRFSVNLVQLKHACRRLVARLADESESETDFVVFTTIGNTLEIRTKNSSEGLASTIGPPGRALVPCPVFCLVKAIRYSHGKTIDFHFSAGTSTISVRTQIRHPKISVRTGTGTLDTAGVPKRIQDHDSNRRRTWRPTTYLSFSQLSSVLIGFSSRIFSSLPINTVG
jgi:hypothetical protein